MYFSKKLLVATEVADLIEVVNRSTIWQELTALADVVMFSALQ
jgi:hypothetical protein